MIKTLKYVLVTLSILSMFTTQVYASTSDDTLSELNSIETEIMYIEDDSGNYHEIFIEEYTSYPVISDELDIAMYDNNQGLTQPSGMFKEYPIGTTKSWNFSISNDALGISGTLAGTPLTSSIKNKLTNIITQKLGSKIGASIIPGINIAGWVASLIGGVNSLVGNNGFHVTVKAVYTSSYYHSGGYYVYGWSMTSLNVSTY